MIARPSSLFIALCISLPGVVATGASEGEAVANYTVGSQDVLAIQIIGGDDPQVRVTVTAEGRILMPYLGKVAVGGKTTSEIEALLRERLADGYYVNPRVAVSVQDYRSKKVLVIGQAANPGEIPVVKTITLIELVTKVGGAGEGSDKRVTVIRGRQDTRERRTFELDMIMAGGEDSAFVLRPGDIVLFPRVDEASVYVTGEVKKAGIFPLTPGMTVQQAIVTAGGLTELASERKIYISRVEDGKEVRFKAKPTDRVLNDDIITVKQGWF